MRSSILIVSAVAASSLGATSEHEAHADEINITADANGLMVLQPGHDYIVYFGVACGVTWAVAGNRPFSVQTKGVRIPTANVFGIPVPLIMFPNPFDSPWMSADAGFDGSPALWGKTGADDAATLYILVRVS